MAKYSDYIQLQDFLPVYDIANETSKSNWRSFIPTAQFCDLLQHSLTAITSSEVSKRKSIWVRGTFGTGKSHASSVVKHLLCDDIEEIKDYLLHIEDVALRKKIENIRANKRYFSVVLKGVEGAYDIPHFSLSLQRETKKALAKAGYCDLVVNSDFQEAIKWVESHEDLVENVLDDDPFASSVKALVDRLKAYDSSIYLDLEKALREKYSVQFPQQNISEWLAEVEREIEAQGIASGLIIFWDEFTSVMETIKSDRINVLQNIAEKSQEQNVYLFLISHRAEQQGTDSRGKDISKMSDRYDLIEYRMDEVSTYLIMRHTFDVKDDMKYTIFKYNQNKSFETLLNHLCEYGSDEERRHINELFPLHPYTAFLCSQLSDHIGSSNRSVIRFMNDEEKGFKAFIDSPDAFNNRRLLTAEWLWDFFMETFDNDPKCSIFTNTYRTYVDKVEKYNKDAVRVFKSVLLLNALSSKFGDKKVKRNSPTEENIRMMFEGDMKESDLNAYMNFLDNNQIISRDIFGVFKISVSSFNPAEVSAEKTKVESNYKTSYDFLKYNELAKNSITGLFVAGTSNGINRPCTPQIYSCEENENVIKSKLSKYATDYQHEIHVAIFLSISEETYNNALPIIKDFSERYDNILFVVPSESFTIDYQSKFIDFLTNANVARTHYNTSTAADYEKNAREYVNKWVNRLLNGNYFMYLAGVSSSEGVVRGICNVINKQFSWRLFEKGFESVIKFRSDTSYTYFKPGNSDKVVTQILQAQTRPVMLDFKSSDTPSKLIFEYNGDNLINDVCQLTDAAKAGNSWLVEICRHVDKCIDDAKRKYADTFYISEILSSLARPPYGFFPGKANYVALAYALRKHKDDLFVPGISQPVSEEKLSTIIKEMLNLWTNPAKSTPSKNLRLRFGSPEESKLTKQIDKVFNLKSIAGVGEVKSLAHAKFGVEEFCKKRSGQPLWVLLYSDAINDELKIIIQHMVDLFAQETPAVNKIKELSTELDINNFEVQQLISKLDNFQNGFMNYVNTLEDITIEEDWWEELEEDLNHLPSEIAYHKEADVKSCIYAFCMRKMKQKEKPTDRDDANEDGSNEVHEEENNSQYTTSQKTADPETITKARNCVKNASMPNMFWQKILLDLLDNHPEVSDFVVKNLQ